MLPLQVVRANRDEEPILANLLELYAYDFSDLLGLDLGPDGKFGYNKLPLYWLEPNRHPFLIKFEDKLAGFVLVKRGSEISGRKDIWDMAEFFVLRRYRRLRIGSDAAIKIWREFPGLWEIRVLESNPALQFWKHVISGFTGDYSDVPNIEKNGKLWRLFAFESQRE